LKDKLIDTVELEIPGEKVQTITASEKITKFVNFD